jgi:hypothetical protein
MQARRSKTLGVFAACYLRSRPLTCLIRTAIGLKVKDGVVFAVEKLVHSKLLVPHANRRIQTIDRHIGLVREVLLESDPCLTFSRLLPDC